jgi:hypothetical protein
MDTASSTRVVVAVVEPAAHQRRKSHGNQSLRRYRRRCRRRGIVDDETQIVHVSDEHAQVDQSRCLFHFHVNMNSIDEQMPSTTIRRQHRTRNVNV